MTKALTAPCTGRLYWLCDDEADVIEGQIIASIGRRETNNWDQHIKCPAVGRIVRNVRDGEGVVGGQFIAELEPTEDLEQKVDRLLVLVTKLCDHMGIVNDG